MEILLETKNKEIDLIITFEPYNYGFYKIRKELFRFGKLKVNNNKMIGHNKPHVHIQYEDMNIVCTIVD